MKRPDLAWLAKVEVAVTIAVALAVLVLLWMLF
jgi:hypothetical protein